MIRAVFFDLDGTLLPLREKEFLQYYFGNLGKKFSGFGYHPDQIIKAVWAGTKAMRENDGSKTNEEAFWPVFEQLVDGDHAFFESTFLDFYTVDFDQVIHSTMPSKIPAKIISHLKKMGYRLVLATNPLFPRIATLKRMGWAGLNPDDFEIITTYESHCYSKPNPDYYQSLLQKTNLLAEEVLMVGNDAFEDMISGSLGFDTFLLTDCLNNEFSIDTLQYKHGSMEDLYEYILHFKEVK
ncbi:MAG: HAD family hydrolase [Firmicutes bacterium]|nr:HAD family hydrolase [Bacillota bacterium]